MADALVTTAELEQFLQRPVGSIPTGTGVLLIAAATSVVETAIRQSLLQATSDVVLMGTPEQWLDLPQRPVTGVASVAIDGTALSDWTRFGSRLWRPGGWQRLGMYEIRTVTLEWLTGRFVRQPSQVAITYTHGYAAGDQQLEFARSAVLMLAGVALANPTLEHSVAIDDGTVVHNDALAGMVLPAAIVAGLRRQYGQRASSVRPT